MPNNTPEKKPKPKEILLNLVSSKFGHNNAVLLDDALKIQKKQLENAMLENNATLEDVFKTKGVDISNLDTKQSSNSKSYGQQADDIVQPKGMNPLGILSNLIGNLTGMSAANQAMNSVKLGNIAKAQNINMGGEDVDKQSLIRNRNLESDLMERQLTGGDTSKVYRDPVTGEEVDQETAEEDMKNGLGVYQINQKVSTRAGVVERKLNNIPDLTQEEKKYVNDARMIGTSLSTLESGFDGLYEKYGKANWQSFQIDKMPYLLTQDQEVQDMKSELVYMKAAIPFLRGGKQLTPMEAKRIDVMLNPFGKNKETYKKDIQRFQNEFTAGADIMKFGINAGLMKKLIKGSKKKQDSGGQGGGQSSDGDDWQNMSEEELRSIAQ